MDSFIRLVCRRSSHLLLAENYGTKEGVLVREFVPSPEGGYSWISELPPPAKDFLEDCFLAIATGRVPCRVDLIFQLWFPPKQVEHRQVGKVHTIDVEIDVGATSDSEPSAEASGASEISSERQQK